MVGLSIWILISYDNQIEIDLSSDFNFKTFLFLSPSSCVYRLSLNPNHNSLDQVKPFRSVRWYGAHTSIHCGSKEFQKILPKR